MVCASEISMDSPSVKCLVLQQEAFGAPNHHPEVTGFPSPPTAYIYIYAGELFLVPLFCLTKSQEQYHLKKKSFLQQPEANQELETDPPES